MNDEWKFLCLLVLVVGVFGVTKNCADMVIVESQSHACGVETIEQEKL